ncbi:hypothetical protein HPG69_013916 [Diceros bicornis minor]|uniref:Uncharacterized protein n=1 Tax=Diceros bicornis minor TaxID=77932 RepID=A0A7J7EMS2_DICBM|nr:hypothetical protein HPG69_013916 [Diceros bicornis minor]
MYPESTSPARAISGSIFCSVLEMRTMLLRRGSSLSCGAADVTTSLLEDQLLSGHILCSPPSARPGPQGGDSMTLILTTLVCLGETRNQEDLGEEGFCSGFRGKCLTGKSLPGLSVGSRTTVQAGESVPGHPRSHIITGDKRPSLGS